MQEFIEMAAKAGGFSQRLYRNTATKTLTNTTTKTSLMPAGQGSLLLPQYFLDEHGVTALGIKVFGYYSLPIGGGAITIDVELGATSLASKQTTGLAISAASLTFGADVLVNCLASGASSTVWTTGFLNYVTAAGTLKTDALTNAAPNVASAPDTTAENELKISGTWDTADTGKILVVTNVLIMAYN